MNDEFAALLSEMSRSADAAMSTSLADVFAADDATAMTDDELDYAIFFSLFGQIDNAEDLATHPVGVQMFFAIKLIEGEVGNGGFAQVFANEVDDFIPYARRGYLMLGDEASADLLEAAASHSDDEEFLDSLDERLDEPPWNGKVPWSVGARIRYAREHREDFLPFGT